MPKAIRPLAERPVGRAVKQEGKALEFCAGWRMDGYGGQFEGHGDVRFDQDLKGRMDEAGEMLSS